MGYKFAPLVFSSLVPTGGGAISWRGAVNSEGDLPPSGNADGDCIVVRATNTIYIWGSGKWNDTSLGEATFAIASTTKAFAIITDDSDPLIRRLQIQITPADAANPGAVSTLAQTFAGDKTFDDDVIVIGGIDAKGGIDSSTNTLTIGATADNINIGGPGATITISGDTTYEHVTNLIVKDKTITLNDGGAAGSAGGAGIEIEEDVLGTQQITGYAQVSSDRNAWELKAPNQAGVATIDAGVAGITIDQSSHDPVSIGDVGNSPNLQGGTITGQVLNLQPADATNPLFPFPGVVSTASQSFAGDKTFNDIVIVSGNLEARDGVDYPFSPLQIGFNSLTVEIGAPAEFNGNQITEVGSLTLEPTTTDGVYATLYTNNAPDFASVAFAGTNPGSGEITYTDGGNLTVSSSTALNITSPDVNIGDASGTTDIVGTVTIEYNPADPTDWSPAPDDVIEAIDQLAERFAGQEQDTKEPTGFVNRTSSTLTFSDSAPARTFTITPVGSFSFYVKGKKFTKTSAESIVISAAAGDHYIYYDDSGVLQESIDPDFVKTIILEYAYVAVVYWNTDTNTHTYFGDERHGIVMDGATHGYLHTVFGARFLSGLALNFSTIPTTVDGTGNSASDAQFPSDQGKIRDEDILHEIPVQAQIPILYRQGSLWRKKAADAYPLIYQGTAGYGATLRLPYNQFTGTWQLTEVQDSKFVLVHYFGTNDIDNPFIGIQGIAEYNSIEDARINANTEISSLSGLPFTEFVPVGSVIFQTRDVYTNAPKARIRSTDTGANYVDFRGSQLYTPAGTATTHGLLSGLGNDDHFQYLLADGTRTMGGALDMGTHQINNVVDPSLAQDAATKNYVDTEITSAITGSTSYFAGFDPTTGILTEVPGYTFDDDGTLQIGAQNSITIDSGIDDYISIGISPTVANPGLTNLSAIQVNSPIDETVTNYTPIQVYGYGTSAPTNFNAYNSQTNYTGVGTNITHYLASGSSDCTGEAIAFRQDGTGDAGTIRGVQLVPSGDATTIEGVSFAPTGSYTDATGLKVDLSSATITNRPVGLDINGGTLNSNVSFTTVSNIPTFVDSGNVVRPVFEVESGSPITGTDVLMTNLAGFMDFKDDHTGTSVGMFPLDLGVTSVGFVSQVAVDATKTADNISMCLAGLAIDTSSAGGSITDAHLYRGSAFTFGGSLTIDNLYGLKIEDTLSDKATNTWGISVEDAGADNYLAKSVVIGGVTKKVSDDDIALEIASKKVLKFAQLTAAERQALSFTLASGNGCVLYDTDYGNLFVYNQQWNAVATAGAQDIGYKVESVADNMTTPTFLNSSDLTESRISAFDVQLYISKSGASANYTLRAIKKSPGNWELSQEYVGDDVGIEFTIISNSPAFDNVGLYYTTTNTGAAGDVRYKITTV